LADELALTVDTFAESGFGLASNIVWLFCFY